ncbi:MAG: hypothetical protein ABSE56_00595 [Bryobacteraceae bacterium]|jgi:uncharacterized protein YcfL
MRREDIEKLLGGYATGTLTEEERRALFEAALSDQELFEALAGEEALKELLEDPNCRRQVEQALREQPQGLIARLAGWMRRPQAWALAGTLAATTVLAVVVLRVHSPKPEFEMARQQAPAAAAPAPSVTAAAPSERPRREATRLARRFDAPATARELSPPVMAADRLGAPQPPPIPAAVAQNAAPPAAPAMNAGGPHDQQQPPPQSSRQQAATVGAGSDKSRVARQSTAESIVVESEAPALRIEAKDQKKAQLPAFGMVAKEERAAPLQVRYRILTKDANGKFAEQDHEAPLAAGAQVRVSLTTNQAGYLYVNNSRGVLFATQAAPGVSYLVKPQPGDRLLNVVLSREPITALSPGRKLMLDGRAKGAAKPDDRVDVQIDLSRR